MTIANNFWIDFLILVHCASSPASQPLNGSKKYKYLFSINLAFKNGFLLSHSLFWALFKRSVHEHTMYVIVIFFYSGTTLKRPRGWACVVGHAWFENNSRQVTWTFTKGDIRDSVFEEDNMQKIKVPFLKEIITILVKLNKKNNKQWEQS